MYSLLVLNLFINCYLLHSAHCLSGTHTVPSIGSVSICPLLHSTVCPMSVSTSHWTVCWLCVNMSTALFYSLSTDCQYLTLNLCWFRVNMYTALFYILSTLCQYLTLYRLLVLCHYVNCTLIQSVHCLSVPYNAPSEGSVSLCQELSSIACPLTVSTSHCTVGWFCDTISNSVFYSLSTVCQYLTLYSLLVLCHYVHCCLLHSVHCLSVHPTLQSVVSVSLYPILPSTSCPLTVSTSHWTVCCFCVTMSTLCQYLTLYSPLVLCHYIHCSLLKSVHFLSEPHAVPSFGSVSICPLLSSTFCALSVCTSHCAVFWICVNMPTASFYLLSNVCQ
jgi:hypothetical protein